MGDLKDVLKQAKKLSVPTEAEKTELKAKFNRVKKKLEKEIARRKIKVDVFPGGSFAKGTWLRGTSEVDVFVRFDLKYENISELLREILDKCFKSIETVHGSRHYYKAEGFEFIPIYKIRKHIDARNITDFSPLHVEFVNENLLKEMYNEVRLLKLFCKANGFYGAETHIHAFSGYVLELLVIAYGSFTHVLHELTRKPPKIHINFGVTHKLTEHKRKSPIIIHDPTQPERNASAALTYETFYRFVFKARQFLDSPDISFFKTKKKSINQIRKISKRRGTLLVSKRIKISGNREIFFAKLVKKLKNMRTKCDSEGFLVYDYGYIELSKTVDVYFEFSTLRTSKMKRHYGPPVYSNHYDSFVEKWGGKVYIHDGRVCVDVPRTQTPKKFVSKLLDEI